jgi:membrane-associated phospholipid phosphatase
MELSRRVLPVDRLVALYNALWLGVWAAFVGRVSYAGWLLAVHGVALVLPRLLAEARIRSRAVRGLRDLYPLLWLAAFWRELALLHGVTHARAFDREIAALDLRLFGWHGSHLNLVWMPRMPYPWLSESMHFAYWAYYLLIALPPLAFLVRGRHDALRALVFRLALTYLACFAVYIVYPVYGPRLTLPPYTGPLAHGFFYRLVHASLQAGDSPGCAFPSSHVAGALTIAYAAWRRVPRWAGWLLWLEALGICVSTVYTQNHYPIDVVAGLAWGLALQVVVAPRAARWLAGRRAEGVPAGALLAAGAPRATATE